MDLEAKLEQVAEWSAKTFGPGRRTLGLIKHIHSELREIENNPTDLYEWIDVVILGFDGAWRAGYTPKEIVQALEDKYEKNFNREWPEPPPEDQPSFHIKENNMGIIREVEHDNIVYTVVHKPWGEYQIKTGHVLVKCCLASEDEVQEWFDKNLWVKSA